jgi:hypothetical protein
MWNYQKPLILIPPEGLRLPGLPGIDSRPPPTLQLLKGLIAGALLPSRRTKSPDRNKELQPYPKTPPVFLRPRLL